MKKKLLTITALALMLMACHKPTNSNNPLLAELGTPYGVPAFDKIALTDYMPALEEGRRLYDEEINAIVTNSEAPTFENTVVALERSGEVFNRVSTIFFNILEADGNAEMDSLAEVMMPILSEQEDKIMLNEALFARIKAVYEQKDALQLQGEDLRLLEETYKSFVRCGANLTKEQKERLTQINQELSLLSLKFGQNVVQETNAEEAQVLITDINQLKGLPESALAAAKEEAEAAGKQGWLFSPKRTSFTPVLQYCENRELRRQLLLAYTTRCNHDNAFDILVIKGIIVVAANCVVNSFLPTPLAATTIMPLITRISSIAR